MDLMVAEVELDLEVLETHPVIPAMAKLEV